MGYITEKEYKARLKKIENKNASKERKRKLREENNKYKFRIKKPSTSKIVLFGVILLCLEIVVFCEYVMITFGDATAMYVLIGIPASLIPIIWAYFSKSKAENTRGGIVFESAMIDKQKHEDAYCDSEDLSGDDNDIVG